MAIPGDYEDRSKNIGDKSRRDRNDREIDSADDCIFP